MAGWDVIGFSGRGGKFMRFQGLVEVVSIFEFVVVVCTFPACPKVLIMAETSWVHWRIASREGPGLISPV